VFRWTATVDPERHLRAAELPGADVDGVVAAAGGECLAATLIDLMRRTGLPNGLAGVGFGEDDVPALAEGTLPQHRVTKLSPRPVERADLEALFRSAMRYW
jgi:hydroxyacid-oxoacid transhydrogenase